MSEILTRNPQTDEIPRLKSLWSSVFGNIGIDSFFRLFYKPDLCAVVELDGSLAAGGYLLPSGDIKTVADSDGNEKNVKCAMIYSIGTLSEYRGLGLGTIIVNDLLSLAGELGYTAVVLCPSDDGLFEYYSKRTGLRDWFYVNESVFTKLPAATPSVLPTKISIDEYLSFREKLLTEVLHIRQEEQLFQYQLELCNELGGGLFRIGDSCAVIERQSNGDIWIKELLVPGKDKILNVGVFDDTSFSYILASIAHLFPADEYLIRVPAKAGTGRRFGMLKLCENVLELSANNEIAPWYGMAFD
jgi:GNAT superfamily N-acetyltransferase